RCLARAVRTDEADDLLLGDGEVDRRHSRQTAESFGDALGLQNQLARAHDVPEPNRAPGGASIAPGVGPPRSSRWRRRLGMMPSGRNRIIRISAAPNSMSRLS